MNYKLYIYRQECECKKYKYMSNYVKEGWNKIKTQIDENKG